jgi:tetratricopeptide (TPR) repeat protein
MGLYALIPPSECQAQAREELKKASELERESAAGLAVKALLALLYDWDTRASLQAFRRALELDPYAIPCRCWHSWALLNAGHAEDAIKEIRHVTEVDPKSPYAHAMAGFTLILADRMEDRPVAHERRALELEPKSLQATWILALALAARSDWDEALEWFGRAVERSSRAPVHLGFLAWCQAASGRRELAQQTLTELQERSGKEYIAPLRRSCWLGVTANWAIMRGRESFFRRLSRNGAPCLRFHRCRASENCETNR